MRLPDIVFSSSDNTTGIFKSLFYALARELESDECGVTLKSQIATLRPRRLSHSGLAPGTA
jgi:hypothetical protein